MRKLALAAAAAALVAALVWWLRRDAASSAEIAAPAQANAPSARVDSALALPASEPSRTEAAHAAETSADVQPTPAAASLAPPAPGELELRGTIAVEDEHGNMLASEDGHFSLVLWPSSDGPRLGRPQEVRVSAGRWSTEVPADIENVSASEIELGGRTAELVDPVDRHHTEIKIPHSRELALRARWLRATRLVVKASDTGLELDAVELIRVTGWPQVELRHPGDAARTTIHASARSPIDVPPPPDVRAAGNFAYYARAPGYAWGRIEIGALPGGERLLEIDPGGGLDVTLLGGIPGPGAVLRMCLATESLGRPPLLQLVAADRVRHAIESIPVGRYRVSVEVGDWWEDPPALGSAEVEIRTGGRTELTFAVEAPAAMALAPLGGVVVVPSEWSLGGLSLSVELLDPPLHGQVPRQYLNLGSNERVSGSADTYRWTAGSVQPGHYELELTDVHYSISLELPPAGREDVRFEVPSPGLVAVRVLDAATRAPAEIDAVSWNCRLPEWVDSWSVENATWNADAARWEFRAPQCWVEIGARSDDYMYGKTEVLVGPGTTEATLELQRASMVLVAVRDGDVAIPMNEWGDVWLETLEGAVVMSSWSSGPHGTRMGVPEPGRYRVRAKAPPGYLPIEEREVELEVGREVELVIQLERKP